MNETSPILIAAIIFAIAMDFGLIYLLRGFLSEDKNGPRATFLGAYSPFLTWLHYHRLPRTRLKLPSFFQYIPWAVMGLGLALLLAVISQWQLLDHPSTPGWPLIGFAISALIFLTTNRRVLPPDPAVYFPPILPQLKIRRTTLAIALFSSSLAACIYTIQLVDRWFAAPMDFLPVLTWWISILLFIAAILILAEWHWPSRENLSVWWHGNWPEGLLLLSLFILALIIRVVDLPWFPYAMMNDEGEVGKAALAILNGLTNNMFRTGWSAQPIWSFVPNVFMIALLGDSLTAVRLVSAIEGALAVVFLYLLAREAFGREVALLAAVGLVGLAWHIHFSRLGVHNVIDSLFAVAVLWLTYRAMQRGHLTDYLLAGLVTGLTVYTYVGSRLVLVIAMGLLAYGLFRRTIRLRDAFLHLLVYLGAVIIVAGPMSAHFVRYPDEFMARTNAVSMLIGGRLEQLALASTRSIPEVLLSQFVRSTLVYVTGSASAQFFFSPRPYLPWLAAVFLILGLAYATWRAGEPRYMIICFWLWMVVIFGSTLTSAPPSNQRLIMSAPAVTLLVAIGVWQIVRLTQQLGLISYRIGLVISLIIMFVSSIQGIAYYFGEYRLGHYFENPAEEFSYEVALTAHDLGPAYRLFVIALPTLTSGSANLGYLAADIEKADFNTVTQETLESLPTDKGALFAAIPMRLGDLEKVARWFPGGVWRTIARRFQSDKIAYFTYLVSPSLMKARATNSISIVDPYEQTVDSPDGRFSAKLKINRDNKNEKPAIELRDKAGFLLWRVIYQYPLVSPFSNMTILNWAPDSSKVYFYYSSGYNLWYTIFKGSDLQSLNAYTGEVKDVIAGCCVDFNFSPDVKRIAYTSGNNVGILDLVTGSDKNVDILTQGFEQAGRILFSPSGSKVIFHTLSDFNGASIVLDSNTMEQKLIMKNYLMANYEFDGWTSNENPRYLKGNEIIIIDLETLSQTAIGTVTPQP